MNATTWTKHSPAIMTALAVVTFRNDLGRSRTHRIAFRLDAREGGWRVDIRALSVMTPWESIDGGVPFARLADAKRFCTSWKRAARRQRTLTPLRVERACFAVLAA